MSPAADIARTRFGRDRLPGGATMRRHRHAIAYVAVVLAGGYLESGDAGRRRVARRTAAKDSAR